MRADLNLSPYALHPARGVASVFLACLLFGAPAQAVLPKQDDLLLLDFVMERQRLATSVTAYAVGNSAVVSLAEAGAALEFPILVDAVAGTATGWFIRPERTFKLNLKEGYAEIEGKRVAFSSKEVFRFQEGIFVTLEMFSRWFPVKLQLQPTTLTIEVEPRERLPVQERQARRLNAQQVVSIGPATLPLIETPYKLIGPHAADIGLGYSTSRQKIGGQATTGLNYSVLLAGDIAYMDSRIYMSGDKDDALSAARITLSRDQLGLPLGLRYVEVGDIVPAIVPGLSYTGVERGILVQGGGSAVGRDDLIGSNMINLSGDALEGWDVELFQNGMRLALQTVGANGRYNFTDIDPYVGENIFELVFYGPAGERRTEMVTRYSGMTPDRPGSVRYQFSASQKGTQLYTGNTVTNPAMTDIGSTRLAAGVELRVLPSLALRSSWNNLVVDGRQLNFYSIGARAGWRDMTFSAEATRDPLTGARWDGSIDLPAKARIWGFDTRFSHTQYAQTLLADDGSKVNLTSRTGISLSGPIGKAATVFSLFHNREVGRSSNSASAGFTARTDRVTFGNTLSYYQFGSSARGVQDPDLLSGNLFFSTRVHPLSLRGGLSYTLRPDAKAKQYFVDSNLNVAKDMSMNFGLTYDPLTDVTNYTSGLNWQLPQVTLSPRISYDSNGHYSGFVYASFSLAPRPDRSGVMISGSSLASSGAVAGRVFLDNDASNSFSAGDEPLPNVTVRAPQASRKAKTDQQGVAYLTGMSSERATDVMLAAETLPNTQMTSQHAGNSVKPRPTAMAVVDFPVIPTGEIDGRVYALQKGARAPLAGSMIELRNTEGKVVAFKIAERDGFFIFENVPYATYSLNLAGERRESANQPKVTLGRGKNTYSDIDIVIPDASAPPLAAVSPAQRPAAVAAPAVIPPAAPIAKPTFTSSAQAKPIPRKSPDGRLVQLGAFANIESAREYRNKLLSLGLMQDDQIAIVTVDLGAHGLFHRVVATPTTTADELCSALKARGTECFTIAQ